jgi:polysaccharide export outer membrane protein
MCEILNEIKKDRAMTKYTISRLIMTGILTVLICLAAGWAQNQPGVRGMDYRLGAKDLLEVTVLGVPEINKLEVRVSEDGSITLPFLGQVSVEGLSKGELEIKLASLLEQNILQDAQVTILIKEYQSNRVSVLGAVRNPGTYELLGRRTVLWILSIAGGLTNDAGDEIMIIRQLADGSSSSLRIPLEDLILKGDPTLNLPLEPNDIVNIPIDKLVQIYVGGAVNKPGALAVKQSRIPTLLQAIMMAGGFSQRASKSGVILKRTDSRGVEQQQKLNVKDIIKGKSKDIPLKEGDIVIVPESIF